MSKRADLRRKARGKTPEKQANTFTLFLVGGLAALAIIAIIALALTRPVGSTGATASGANSQNPGAQPYPEIARIGLAEARAKLGQPGVVFLDVRSVQEFNESHIQGAKSLPMPDLPTRFGELPKDAEIITYCT